MITSMNAATAKLHKKFHDFFHPFFGFGFPHFGQ